MVGRAFDGLSRVALAQKKGVRVQKRVFGASRAILNFKNHTKRVLDTLTGPQTPVVVAIGLKVVQRPTVQIRWSVVGPLSSLQDKRIIQIEK